MAWLTGWQYRKKITIDQTKVDADLSDFPVLVKLTSSNFDFSKALSTGYDIRFTSSDGETLLKYERERHDQANSLAEYWVKVPSVSGTVDTDFYVYYGKSDASDGADAANVWDSNFKNVYHLKNATTSTVSDSKGGITGNKKAANEPQEENGKVGKAQHFVASNPDYIEVNNIVSPVVNAGDPFTIEYVANLDTLTDSGTFLRTRNAANNASSTFLLFNVASGTLYAYANWNESFTISNTILQETTWYHIVFVASGKTIRKIYLNGLDDTKSAPNNYNTEIWSAKKTMGYCLQESVNPFDGILDEMRVSNSARSDAWIKASYNSNFDTLVSYGGEEQPSTHRQASFFEVI